MKWLFFCQRRAPPGDDGLLGSLAPPEPPGGYQHGRARPTPSHRRRAPPFRDVEDLLAERGIKVSYETVRRWVNHFAPMIAKDLRKRRPKPHATWHLERVPRRRNREGIPDSFLNLCVSSYLRSLCQFELLPLTIKVQFSFFSNIATTFPIPLAASRVFSASLQ
jgi:hypothetical protein